MSMKDILKLKGSQIAKHVGNETSIFFVSYDGGKMGTLWAPHVEIDNPLTKYVKGENKFIVYHSIPRLPEDSPEGPVYLVERDKRTYPITPTKKVDIPIFEKKIVMPKGLTDEQLLYVFGEQITPDLATMMADAYNNSEIPNKLIDILQK